MARGKTSITVDEHKTLLDAFTEKPGNIKYAAEIAKVHWNTAKRAWLIGWRDYPPIERLLRERHLLARSLLSRTALAVEAESVATRAEKSVAESLAAEALVAKAVRGASIDTLTEVVALRDLTAKLVAKLCEANMRDVDHAEAMEMLRSVNALARDAVGMAKAAVELERLRVGDPTLIVGVRSERREHTVEEIEAEVEAAKRALDMVRETEAARLEDGGKNGVS